MKVGVRDIAKEAGVAVSTVSHALNGTAPISREVRERVIEAARRMGYLDQRRIKAMIPTLHSVILAMPCASAREIDTNLVSYSILNGLKSDCARRSISMTTAVNGDESLDLAALRIAVQTQRAGGIVVLGEDRPQTLRALRELGVPVVLVNGADPTMELDAVMPASRTGAKLATEHLLGLGHRRILHMTWPGRQALTRRAEGFRDALLEAGQNDPMMLQVEGFEPEQAGAAIDRLMARPAGLDGITAIFCSADTLALGVLRALERHGLRVPQDISVMGFDDIMPSELSRPPLSTVHVPLEKLGPAALRIIESRLLASDPTLPSLRVELGCRLVLRGTLAPPGAAC